MPRATELDHSASAARAISAPVTALAPPPTVAGAPWRFRAALWWLNRLAQRPFEARWRWARRLAWLHLRGDPVFQEVLRTNLRLCLPRLTDAERTQLAQANAEETFFAWLDRFRCWRLDPAQLRAQVMLEGIEHLSRAHGRPVVLVCPHLLGMEAGVQRLSLEVQTIAL
jgi:KDO2-lipid IV(A) lauroyltransferase